MSIWPRVRLDQCTEIVSGATPDTSELSYWGGDICWATPKDLSDLDGAYISDTPRKIARRGLESCAASVLPPESVLFSSRAPIGHVAINTVPMATNQGFKSFVPDRQRVDAKFLYFWLRRNRPYLESLGNGATFKEVSKAVVSRIEIALPPLPEQRRIAEILDKADSLRGKRRAALAQIDTLTQSIFHDMFGDPATNPKGWAVSNLGELISVGPQNGLYKPASDYGTGTPILRIDAFYDGVVTGLVNLKRVLISDRERTTYGLRSGEIVINRVNSREYLGKSALIPMLHEPVVFESNMMRLGVDPTRIDSTYLIHLLQTPHVRAHILRSAKDAVNQSSINQQDVKAIPVMLPPLPLQSRFAGCVRSLDRMRNEGRFGLSGFDTLFASLQHRAFRGEL